MTAAQAWSAAADLVALAGHVLGIAVTLAVIAAGALLALAALRPASAAGRVTYRTAAGEDLSRLDVLARPRREPSAAQLQAMLAIRDAEEAWVRDAGWGR